MLIPTMLFAQDYEFKSEVVQADGMTADAIYLKAKEWYATTFNSAQDVIQMDEKGVVIIAKGLFNANYSSIVMGKEYIVPMNIYFTLSTKFKEGRYKYDLVITEVGNNAGAAKYPYTTYINSTTAEGYDKMMAEQGIKVGKKAKANGIEGAKKFCNNVSVEADALIQSLKEAIISNGGDDW